MKKTTNKRISIATFLISLVVVAVLASGTTLFLYEHQNKGNTVLSGSTMSADDLDAINYLYEVIQTGYIKKVDSTKLVNGALKGMTDALDDPYSSYMSAELAKDFEEDISGNFEGIGAVMTLKNEMPTVAEPPIKGSPAEKAKLKADDVILKVDGKETLGKGLNEVVKEVRGKKGTTVTLEVARDNDVFTVDIVRDVIPNESVKGNIDKNNADIGYIEIKTFNETTSKEFDDVVTNLREQGAKAFIIDVRSNPGGVLGEVEKISSRFLEDGQTIVKFESRLDDSEQGDVARKALDNGNKIKEPSVLLINENSASASEIMAAAFSESANLPVIGTKTFGKGTVQTLIPIDGMGEVKLTIRKWLTPKGKWIHEKGVKPTIEVKRPAYLDHKMINPKVTYDVGTVNADVKTINDYLKALGYNISDVTDVYTEETATAIGEFQKSQKLDVTEKANPKTIDALERAILDHWKENDTQYLKGQEVIEKELGN